MTDTPKNVISLKGLDLEGTNDPVLVPMPKGNGVITFPDFSDGDAEDVEDFIDEVNQAMATGKATGMLRKWLPEKEFEKFRKAYPKYTAQIAIVGRVLEQLQSSLGDEGEDDA